jgi:hypothetical protein
MWRSESPYHKAGFLFFIGMCETETSQGRRYARKRQKESFCIFHVIWESIGVVEKVNLDVSTDMHVLRSAEIRVTHISSICMSLYLFVWLWASITSDHKAGYKWHSPASVTEAQPWWNTRLKLQLETLHHFVIVTTPSLHLRFEVFTSVTMNNAVF